MWQTKMICTFVAASVPVENAGDVNPLLEAAKSIGNIEDNQPQKRNNAAINAWDSPEKVDNGDASYERFMASFGSPRRWAGRG